MEGKIFELLEKMYDEVQEIKTNMATKEDLSKVEKGLKDDIVRFENKMNNNNKALYDGYKLNYEKLGILKEKIYEIDEEIEKQSVEIKVIKNSR